MILGGVNLKPDILVYNMGQPTDTTRFAAYTFLATFAPLYPLICALNEVGGNDGQGYGYYYLIPQILMPKDQRKHSATTSWPGFNPATESSPEPSFEP